MTATGAGYLAVLATMTMPPAVGDDSRGVRAREAVKPAVCPDASVPRKDWSLCCVSRSKMCIASLSDEQAQCRAATTLMCVTASRCPL